MSREVGSKKKPASGPASSGVSERTCAVCRQKAERDELVRWVRGDDGNIVPDLLGKSFGRGAWVHPQLSCLKRLIPSLERSFKAKIATTEEDALQMLRQAAEHRVTQLLGTASRQGQVVYGSDVTEKAWFKGQVELLIVAKDGRAALNKSFVQEAIQAGLAKAWATKLQLGALLGRSDVAVLGIVNKGLAKRLFGAIAMALLVPDPSAAAAATGPETEF